MFRWDCVREVLTVMSFFRPIVWAAPVASSCVISGGFASPSPERWLRCSFRWLDYRNSAEAPLSATRPLQLIKNAAVCLAFNLPNFSHTTPLVSSIHRLPVAGHIAVQDSGAHPGGSEGTAPLNLSATVKCCTRMQPLRSTASGRLAPRSL